MNDLPKIPKLPIETPSLFGDYKYPVAKELMEQQQDINWFEKEIAVDKDVHDYRHVMSPEQYKLVTTTLQLFVEIEQEVGNIWETISSWFPHSEIDGCATQIAAMEKSVHAFFYQKMSDELNLSPEEIAENQATVKVLKDKLVFIKKITKNLKKDKALSLATVSLIEQVLLFSNFAMLKSFQANGNNLIPNTVLGVTYVTNDEVLHGVFASYLYNTYKAEYTEVAKFPEKAHKEELDLLVAEIIKHEDSIIDYIFRDMTINDINASQLKNFIRHRANAVYLELGYGALYNPEEDSIGEWFFKGANSIKMHDFFISGTNQYRRGWAQEAFTRIPFLEKEV